MKAQLKQIWTDAAGETIDSTVDGLKLWEVKDRLNLKLDQHFNKSLDEMIDQTNLFNLIN